MSRTSARRHRPGASRTRLAVAATGLATGVWGISALNAGATPHPHPPRPAGPTGDATPAAAPAPGSLTGVVTDDSPTSLTVQPAVAGGQPRPPETYSLTGSTIVTLGASPASPAALAVGESVTVTPAASDAASAAGVTILLVRVTGTVSSVTTDTLTVSTADGVDVTIVTTPSTTVTLDGSPAAPPTLAVGDLVTAEGLIAPPGSDTLDATALAASGRAAAAPETTTTTTAPAAPTLTTPAFGPGNGRGRAWGLIRQWYGATSLSVGADPFGDGPGGD